MKILVIAPHPDDEILGCGGVMAKRISSGDDVWICIVSEGKEPMYSEDFIKIERKEMVEAHGKIGKLSVLKAGFPSAMLDTVPQYKLNDTLTDFVNTIKPDEVFIPHKGDVHRDHQIVSDAALVAVRPNRKHKISRVLAYEVLSETDWNIPNSSNAFIPNVYEDISEYIQLKKEAMLEYSSQLKTYPFARTIEGIEALAMHRGVIVGVRYAEAFMLIREVV